MAENVTPVVLKVKDFAEREVMLVDYKFNQATDTEGQVAGIVRGGQITIRVKALNDGNPELLNWMINPADPRDLTVEFQNTKDGSAMKTIKGTGCYCIHFKEYWADGEEHYEEVTPQLPEARERLSRLRESLEVSKREQSQSTTRRTVHCSHSAAGTFYFKNICLFQKYCLNLQAISMR